MLSVKQGSCKYLFEVIDLTRVGIKPKSTIAEADALGTRLPELLPEVGIPQCEAAIAQLALRFN